MASSRHKCDSSSPSPPSRLDSTLETLVGGASIGIPMAKTTFTKPPTSDGAVELFTSCCFRVDLRLHQKNKQLAATVTSGATTTITMEVPLPTPDSVLVSPLLVGH
ncbi:hypothetical protein PC128_g22886 [Phytophthora cactorum]|nr:hypothetical protein PC128_g22886 [Phytophthora cactorum]KAG4042595.1 hypothetical protein PC123_g21919 [Phytophthora cactorum]